MLEAVEEGGGQRRQIVGLASVAAAECPSSYKVVVAKPCVEREHEADG